jgi:hypothetical protein
VGRSADLLRQLDDDPRGTADVAEPVAIPVALQLAHELCAAGSEASEDRVDVIAGAHWLPPSLDGA